MMRAVLFLASLLAAAGLLCRGAAWMAYERGSERGDVSLVRLASRLDPFVSDYAYEEYVQTDDLDALKRAIRLEPAKPVYHMYYGLMLIDRKPRALDRDQEAVKQICQGAELKPYSRNYRETCETYKAVIR